MGHSEGEDEAEKPFWARRADDPYPREASQRPAPSVPERLGIHVTGSLDLCGAAWNREPTTGTTLRGRGFALLKWACPSWRLAFP